MDNKRLEGETAAYLALQRLRDAMNAGPPRSVLETLALSIAELRIMLACRNRLGLASALRRAESAMAIWDAWREGAAEPTL